MRTIAYTSEAHADGSITLRESTGQSITSSNPEELFYWLLAEWKPEPDILFVTWDLGQFAAPLLKKIGITACSNLADPKWNRTEYFRPFVIFFRYKKDTGGLLRIECGPLMEHDGRKHRAQEVSIYSLNHFFGRDLEPPATAEDMQLQADELLRQLDTAGMQPTKLTSPIAAYLSCNMLPAPKSREAGPSQVYADEYARECSREWRDCFQVGHWTQGEAFDFDMVNAYAAAASRLMDTRYADFTYSKEPMPGAYWGFLKGRVTINPDVLVHPIIAELPNGALGTPVGSWDTYLTSADVKFIERWGIGEFEMEDGWFVTFRHGLQPLNSTMKKLYADRMKAKNTGDTALATFLKNVANGFVGKFLETYENPYTLPDGTKTNVGEYYNPIWHAVVTATARLKLAEFIYQNDAQENVIAVNTDGCLLDKMVEVSANPTMGEWKLAGSNPVIVLSPQRVMSGDKHPQGMTYSMLCELIAEHPDSSEYLETGSRYVTLSEAVEAGDISSVGESAQRGRGLTLPAIGASQTRIFPQFPQTGAELLTQVYKSFPIRLE